MSKYKIKLEGNFPKFIQQTKPNAMTDDDYLSVLVKNSLIERMNEKHSNEKVKPNYV